MNEHDDPRDDWALASAYLDGEADEHERALVEADPALLGLVERLRAIQASLAEPVTAPAGSRDGAIAAALADADRSAAAPAPPSGAAGNARGPGSTPTATVHSIEAGRRRRMRWLGGAAAAAVIAVLVGLVASRGGDERSTSSPERAATTVAAADNRTESVTEPEAAAAPAAVATAPASTAAPSIAAAAGGAASLPGTTAATVVVAIDDPTELLQLAGANADALPATAITSPACLPPGETVLALITYRGTPAVATFDAPAGLRRARALADCAVLAEIAATS